MLIPVLTAYEKEHIGERQPLPERYLSLSDEEMDRRILAAKRTLGRRLVILGHHYQRDEVIKFADYIGDSFKLAGQVSRHPDAEFIVFCGVHFMAESADVLSGDDQKVILPDLAAGCSMADMADAEQLEQCWSDLQQMGILHDSTCVPVTYINSAASIKAFCGEHGGVVCTSSNAAATLRWAWERGERILFLPDQHLGRNTAHKLGIPLDQIVVWDPNEIWGGLEPDAVQRARIILWKGHCSVHTRFTVRQIENIRSQHPGVRVIVHPEVPLDVVQAADDSGSTEYIIDRFSVGGRHRNPPRQSSGPSDAARPDGPVTRSIRLPLLHDVPSLAQPPVVGARRARRRSGPQPHHRPRPPEALDQGRAGSDARHFVGADLRVRPVRHIGRPLRLASHAARKYDLQVLPVKEDVRWLTRFRPFRTRLTRSNLTSTSRRWRFITASITTRTSRT